MKISVVVSVYNTPFNMLAPSLDSIVSQKCQCDYEVIIVDDGSQKEVHDFLEKICRENDHCRLITHEVNKGLSAARNTGMDNISGEYLFFPDSDDILFPGAIQRIFECLSEYPDVSFISFGWIQKSPHGEKKFMVTKKQEIIYKDQIIYNISGDFAYKGYMWNKVFNVKLLTKDNRDLPRFDTSLKVYEDKIWMLEMADRFEKVLLIPDCLYSYEFNTASITRLKETLRERQFRYYSANRRIVKLSKTFGYNAYYAALEYFFSLTWNDYFYWMFVSHFNKQFAKENAAVVCEVLSELPKTRIKSSWNRVGYQLFKFTYKILGVGK